MNVKLRPQLLYTSLAALLVLGHPTLVQADDLVTVWRTAQSQDASYKAARHALEMAMQKVPQARAALLPSVSLSAGRSQQVGAASFDDAADVARDVRGSNWNLQLTQPLLRPERWASMEQAEAQLRQAQAQFRLAAQDLVVRAAQAYFDVLVAQQSANVAEAQLSATGQQLELARRNFQVGISTVTDVHEATSRFELARAQRVAAYGDVEQRSAELEKVVGAMPQQLGDVHASATLPAPESTDPRFWATLAQEQHPQVLVQRAAVDAATQELSKQRAAHLPTLDITASRAGSFSSGSLSTPANLAVRTRATQLALALTVPLYAGGGTQSRVREAIAAIDKAEAELLATRRQVAAAARQALAGVLQGRAQAEALAAAVAASRNALEASQIGYRIGTRINIDVLNAQQQMFTVQRDLFKARVDTLMQFLKLKAAAGSLDEQDVRVVNALLGPFAEPVTPTQSGNSTP